MRKEWQPMQLELVGQVQEVVQGNRGKFSEVIDTFSQIIIDPEPE